MTTGPPEPCREPWRTTAIRTGSIALAIGAAVGIYQRRIGAAASTTLVALWFTLGGHFAEVLFRNHLRYRIGGQVVVQVLARLLYWFIAGSVLSLGAIASLALVIGRSSSPWPWWAGGAFFIALELAVHLVLRRRGLPSFYDGRG